MDRRRTLLNTQNYDPDQYFKVPRYAVSIAGMFRSVKQITDFTLDLSEAENLNSLNNFIMQTTMTTLHIIGEFPTNKDVQMRDVFRENPNLTAITGTPLNCSKWIVAKGTFDQDPKLEYIRFVPNTINFSISFKLSSLLSDESIQSIIDGLATVTSSTELILHQTVKDKLTEEQKSIIESKGWTIS
jgi:hypothetical protein